MMAFSSGVMRYFYPRPPRGRRRENIQCEAKLLAISIHALREEGDVSPPFWGAAGSYFYPRPPRGGRPAAESLAALTDVFLSTPSARRATTRIPPGSGAATNFYPRPLRGGRPYPVRTCFAGIMISIHALREEGDDRPGCGHQVWRISIHALREEGDAMLFFSGSKHRKFLSTPSARRATAAFSAWPAGMSISIHALREEGDPAACR